MVLGDLFSVTLQQQSLHLQMKEWTVDISTTLTAGLIGSLIGSIATACLTYLVQQKLAAKRREEEERRLAFVYLVQITPFVATEQILKNLGAAVASTYGKFVDSELEKIKSSDGTLDDTQAWCALIAAGLDQYIRQGGKISYSQLSRHLHEFSESLDSYKIPMNLLSQVPAGTVVAYYEMLGSIDTLKNSIKYWELWGLSKGKDLISADTIHSQLIEVGALSKNARILRELLISRGKVPSPEADKILKAMILDGTRRSFSSLGLSPKLEKAQALAQTLLEEKMKGMGINL